MLLKKFIPHKSVNTIYDIDLQALKETGVKGIITDLDNTLVGAKAPQATPELRNWLHKVKQMGFQVVIVSNNVRTRVSEFAQPLSVPFIYKAKKPTNKAFRDALAQMNLSAEEVVVVGDQMVTDVFGGNRMGLYTILVTPISLKDEGFMTRINRRIEKIIIKRLKQRGLIPWEDSK